MQDIVPSAKLHHNRSAGLRTPFPPWFKTWVQIIVVRKRDYYFGNLPADRLLFSTGRDLMLEPKQKSGPVNFFVYPHVEVEGNAHLKLKKQFSFEAISGRPASDSDPVSQP